MQIRRTTVIIILGLILLLQVGLRLPFLPVPLERDEGAYGYMAQRVLAGELPYRDAFDHKPPLVYYFYAGAIKIFGNNIEAVRIPTLFYSLFTTAAVFYLGFVLWGSSLGLVSALLYAVFSGGVLIQGASSNTEVFMALPLVLAFVFFIRGTRNGRRGTNYFWAGLFSGVAFVIKQVAALNFIVLFGFLFYEVVKPHNELGGIKFRRFQSAVLPLTFGFALFPLLFTFYFWSRGALSDYIYCVFLVNRTYLRSLPFGPLARAIHGFYTTFIIARLENSLVWVFGLVAVTCIFLRGRQQQNLLLALWFLASLLAVASSGLFFGHYYIQVVPALCLLSAYAVKSIIERGVLWTKLALVILVVLLFVSVLPYQYPYYFKYSTEEISRHQYGKDSYVISYRLAQELRKFLKPEEKILVWAANPEVYFYLDKKSPTRYFNYLGWMENEKVKDEILASIFKEKPDYIVWTGYTLGYKRLVDFVESDYRFFMKIGKWKVFKIRV